MTIERKGTPKIKERVGLAIRKRRHELSMSQEGLATRVGLQRTYIADIERGIRNVSIENVEKLAGGLEISISSLFREYGVEQ